MTDAFDHPRRVAVAAPTAELGFVLERLLSHLRPTLVGAGGEWRVELTVDREELDELMLVVRQWLSGEHLAETIVHVNGERRRVRAGSRPRRLAHG